MSDQAGKCASLYPPLWLTHVKPLKIFLTKTEKVIIILVRGIAFFFNFLILIRQWMSVTCVGTWSILLKAIGKYPVKRMGFNILARSKSEVKLLLILLGKRLKLLLIVTHIILWISRFTEILQSLIIRRTGAGTRYWRWETIAGVITGFSTPLISLTFLSLVQHVKSLPRICTARFLPQAVNVNFLKRACFLLVYFSFTGLLLTQYGKRIGLSFTYIYRG